METDCTKKRSQSTLYHKKSISGQARDTGSLTSDSNRTPRCWSETRSFLGGSLLASLRRSLRRSNLAMLVLGRVFVSSNFWTDIIYHGYWRTPIHQKPGTCPISIISASRTTFTLWLATSASTTNHGVKEPGFLLVTTSKGHGIPKLWWGVGRAIRSLRQPAGY